MSEQVILVNQNDQALNYMDKAEAHQKGVLHRAISVFIFNEKREMIMSFLVLVTKSLVSIFLKYVIINT